MGVRIAINGFGRIGRCVTRVAMADSKAQGQVEIVAINDITSAATLAHLFKYDSVHGRFSGNVTAKENEIAINNKSIRVLAEKDPKKLPWKDMEVDVVLECTGLFLKREAAAQHLEAGAKKVVLSAPAKGAVDLTLCMGVNSNAYDPKKHDIVSNASCTTNCLAPVAKVLHENWGIENGFMTTIHSYTSDQRILDAPHSDLRRARAGVISMVPTTTGAAKAIGLVLPELVGKLDGLAIRVPTPDVSVVDLNVNLKKSASIDAINKAFQEAAAAGPLKGILEAVSESLVSVDFIGSTYSSSVDLKSTMMVTDKTAKVLAWYDNEMGYSARLWDACRFVAEKV